MEAIDTLLLLIGPVLDAVLALALLRQKYHREFPFFFSYIVVDIAITILRLVVIGNYTAYFWVFWATEPIYGVMTLLALHEAFRSAFLAFYRFWWFWLIFPTAVATILSFQIVSAIRHPPTEAPLLIAVILSFAKSINYVEAGLFGLFFFLVWFLGLRWQNRAFGIVMGFAALALGAGYAFATRSAFGTKFNTLAKYGPPVAYILAVVIWLVVFLVPSESPTPEDGVNTAQPEQLLVEVTQYTRILRGFFRKQQ